MRCKAIALILLAWFLLAERAVINKRGELGSVMQQASPIVLTGFFDQMSCELVAKSLTGQGYRVLEVVNEDQHCWSEEEPIRLIRAPVNLK